MAEILGLGCTHRPLMMRSDRDWTGFLRRALDDPDLPGEMKNPGRWPARMREELADDFGIREAARSRDIVRQEFIKLRMALDAFKPDLVIIWGDDQYENFREDLVPPFALLAYEDQDIQPWKEQNQHQNQSTNPWHEPADMIYRIKGQREAGKYLATRLIEAGFDMPYGYQPRYSKFGHSFKNTVLLLDYERLGFPYPVVQIAVNCYGRRVNASQGVWLPLAMRDRLQELDPPGPNPSRCMELGAAVAKIIADSPWRVALIATSSWSHSFLTEKNFHLWPDVDADRRLYKSLQDGDYKAWRRCTTASLEDAGQHELLNWHCLLGAMEWLGCSVDSTSFIETYAFVASAVFAQFHPI